MPLTNDIRKTLTDPTPLYFAAGVLDKIRAEAPERIAAVRATDPREVQARVSTRARQTQVRVNEALTTLDADIKKLREQAQTLALLGVGLAAEYAVKARETYGELAERGRGAVQTWRGEDEAEAPRITVERELGTVTVAPAGKGGATSPDARSETGTKTDARTESGAKTGTGTGGTGASAGSGTRKRATGGGGKTGSTAEPGAQAKDGAPKAPRARRAQPAKGNAASAKSDGAES